MLKCPKCLGDFQEVPGEKGYKVSGVRFFT